MRGAHVLPILGRLPDPVGRLSRRQKRLILMFADTLLVAFSLWAAVAVRIGSLWPDTIWSNGWWLLVVLPAVGVALFHWMGLYRLVLRSMGRRGAVLISQAVLLLSLGLMAFAYFDPQLLVPRSTPIIFSLVLAGGMISLRSLGPSYYYWLRDRHTGRLPVLIYGAGESGMQLAAALNAAREFRPVGFLDDDPSLIGGLVAGHRVHSPKAIEVLLQRYQVSDVLLALPSISRVRRKEIVTMLAHYPIRIQSVPSMVEIVSGLESISHLRKVGVEELLERDAVDPMVDLFSSVHGRSVMVTGAGGSIGSELCRQIVTLGASQLVLFESSELALYAIEMELRSLIADHTVELHAILGSVCDEEHLDRTVRRFAIQTIYHAAAYKHVPLVEANPLEGIKNNVFGTLAVATVAARCKVQRAILISTDKAVRPTNVMGATKRLAELVFRRAQADTPDTIYSMVRFGNVMGSSGSVIPLFARQIAEGGPVTVTDPEVIRYFMTIPEAAQLVIQAGSMGEGGDVFLLDMGDPVSILDMARRMIHLSGLEVKDADNPHGDIEIVFTGLRPGEKLFEELLVSGHSLSTRHPKIMRSLDSAESDEAIDRAMADLRTAVANEDIEAALAVFGSIVEGYRVRATRAVSAVQTAALN